MMILKGFRVDDLRDLVAAAMEPVLKPLVYHEPLQLVARHRERGEPVYIVSATLQEIVEELARELGFDGAIGSTCEIVDGVYTGRSLRAVPRRGEGRGGARARRAGGHRPRRLDRVLRQPHRPAVPRGGRATPSPSTRTGSCAGSRPSAAGRCSRSTSSPIRASSRLPPALIGHPARRSARAPRSGPHAPCGLRSAIAALGFSAATRRRSPTTSTTPSRAASSATGSRRIEWLETLGDLEPAARPQRLLARARLRALGRRRRARLPDARRDLRRAARGPARARARRRRLGLLPDRRRSATGCAGSPRAASSPR